MNQCFINQTLTENITPVNTGYNKQPREQTLYTAT